MKIPFNHIRDKIIGKIDLRLILLGRLSCNFNKINFHNIHFQTIIYINQHEITYRDSNISSIFAKSSLISDTSLRDRLVTYQFRVR